MAKTSFGVLFLELWKSSSLIQGTIALLSTGVIAYLYIAGKTVPDTLVSIVMIILGYYFGTKAQLQADKDAIKYATRYQHGIDPGADSKS